MKHEHGSRGSVVHQPPADSEIAYRLAYEAAQPDPGREVILVNLEAAETEWTSRSSAASSSATTAARAMFG